MVQLKKTEEKRSEIVKMSLLSFFSVKQSFMFRQHFVVKYKLTYLGI